MVAAIARYHRRSLPKKSHSSWQVFSKREHRRIVSEMAILLRLAASLDRRPEPAVTSINARATSSEIIIELKSQSFQDLSLEKWSLMNCSDAIRDTYDLVMRVEISK